MQLKARVAYLKNHWFVRQAAVLQFGTTLGNIIQAIISILLARALDPDRYGVYALAMSLASLLSIVLASGFQEAASSLLGASYARKNNEEINEILSFYTKLILYSILITFAVMIAAPFISEILYGNKTIGYYALIVVAASLISSTLFSITTVSLQITGEIRLMSLLMVTDLTVRWGLSLLLVYLGYGIWGAVAGHLIGAVIIFLVASVVWHTFLKRHQIFPTFKKIFSILGSVPMKKYLGFSFLIAIDRNVAMLYFILPVIMAGIYISATEVGYFKLAFGYINLAMTILVPVSVLLNVVFPKMKVGEEKNLRKNFIKVSVYSTVISFLVTIAIVLASTFAFRFIYGENFLPSVRYVWGLFIYGALFGIGVGLGPMWRALNRVKVSILINTLVLIVGIPLSLFLMSRLGGWGAVISVTFLVTVSHLISFIYLVRNIPLSSVEAQKN